MQYVIILFLNDLDTFINAQSEIMNTVADRSSQYDDGIAKTDNFASVEERRKTGVFVPYSLPGAVASAINNTGQVSFKVKTAP